MDNDITASEHVDNTGTAGHDTDDHGERDTAPDAARPAWNDQQWALFALAMIASVVLLVGAAVHASGRDVDGPGSLPPDEPSCSTTLECCVARWGRDECCAVPESEDEGLFDAEEEFARHRDDVCG